MKNVILILLLSFTISGCSQNSEIKGLPEKTIGEVVIGHYTTSLSKLELKGKIKSVIEEYENSNSKDTIIDFSKYELTNSDIKKEKWFISPKITKYYKANFNKKGYLTKSVSCEFGGNDSTFVDNTYDENLLVTQDYVIKDYQNGRLTFQTVYKTDFIYDKNKNISKVLDNGRIRSTYKYYLKKNQIEAAFISPITDSLETEIKTYNKYGLLMSVQSYDHNNIKGDLRLYEYDQEGKLIKEKLHKKDGGEQEYKERKIDKAVKVYRLYDEYNNCVERIIFNRDGRLAIRKLTIEYY